MKKVDIRTHSEMGRERHPAINVSWWPDEKKVREHFAEIAGFEFNLPADMDPYSVFADEDLWGPYGILDDVRERQWYEAKHRVIEMFDAAGWRNVEVWQEGRSGKWMVVFGLPDIESWDAILVSLWGRVVREVMTFVEDCDYQLAWGMASEIERRTEMFV